jgi:uncharacterized Rmd1/YagE family protein
MIFKAYAVANELDLNKIASLCGIPKKYTWEEPLILTGQTLTGILRHEVEQDRRVLVFAFGSVVLVNMNATEEKAFMEYLKKFQPEVDLQNYHRYSDDYELREGEVKEGEDDLFITDQYVVLSKLHPFHPELISVVIAKSVALEKTEAQVEKILDLLEGMLDRLEKAKLRISDRELARTYAKIIRHEYNTIAYIMILDKPDITWANSEAASFYDRMSEFFELNDRFEVLKEKSNILRVIMNHFSTISRSLRGLFVEWLIVLLILVEVFLMVAELLR